MVRIFILVLAAFLFYQFWNVIQLFQVLVPENNFQGLFSFITAWTLNLIAIGIFGILGNVFQTSKILPSNYYFIENEALLKTCYRLLGVKYFRKALLFFHWGKPKHRKKFFDGTRLGVQQLILQSKQAEFGHLAAFLLTVCGSIYVFTSGYLLLSVYLTLFNLIGNLYPIILQRYHRVRIQKMTLKQE